MKINNKIASLCFSSLLFLSSCSWLDKIERKLVGDEQKEEQKKLNQSPVSRNQYNELLAKYEELNKKYQSLI